MKKYNCKNCLHRDDNNGGCRFSWLSGREGCQEDHTPVFPISFDAFRRIKAGDKVLCGIGGKFSLETVTQGAFYNYDADAPEWEIETENGFFCWDSVCVVQK